MQLAARLATKYYFNANIHGGCLALDCMTSITSYVDKTNRILLNR